MGNTCSPTYVGGVKYAPSQTRGIQVPIYKDTTPFVPPVTYGYVVKVYDGDTITVASKLPWVESPLYRFSVRLDGIDTPELKTKSLDEKTVAVMARDRVSELVFGKGVRLENVSTEKYGRLLAKVYLTSESDKDKGLCINDLLLEERLAVKYDGGTKLCPRSWVDYNTDGTFN